MQNLVKTNNEKSISLCDYHMGQLRVPFKFKGQTSLACSECPVTDTDNDLFRPKLNLKEVTRKRLIYVVTFKIYDKRERDCKVICSDCLPGFLSNFNAELIEQNEAPETYSCSLCHFAATFTL